MTDEVLLEAKDVRKWFGGVHAVDGTSLRVRAGRVTGLIGPNGAGKSTMLSLLAGFDLPDSGEIVLFGEDVTRQPEWKRARSGLIRTFQASRQFSKLTVLDNLMVAPGHQVGESLWGALFRPRAWRENERKMLDRAYTLLDRFALLPMANDYAGNLSGGQRRLLEMARALMAEPRVLLLDEPLAGVNPKLIDTIAGHIESLRDEGMTILLIEHELGVVERLCDPIIVMAQGRVLDEGSMALLRENSAVVEAYLAG
jgi:ABC-type branched-subunit amino acid transport system ATPase component